MGKIGDFFKKLKEENRNLGTTTARINNTGSFYGNVNRGIKNGDFWQGSYVSIENGSGVIYGSAQDDYVFTAADIASFELIAGARATVSVGNQQLPASSCMITFKDGKTAKLDIVSGKLAAFTATFGV